MSKDSGAKETKTIDRWEEIQPPGFLEERCDVRISFINGCMHDCKYCYSKAYAIRHKRKTSSNWRNEEVRQHSIDKLKKTRKRFDGVIMFPSTHDIHPGNLDAIMDVLHKLLHDGNDVLLCSKPHSACVQKICDTFGDYKEQMLFRFAIGSADSDVLKFWEPNAPDFSERLECLQYAFSKGFQTRVACEPMLETNLEELVSQVSPYVTKNIWIELMIQPQERLTTNGTADEDSLGRASALQSTADIIGLYDSLKTNPVVKWKKGIQRLLLRNNIRVDQ